MKIEDSGMFKDVDGYIPVMCIFIKPDLGTLDIKTKVRVSHGTPPELIHNIYMDHILKNLDDMTEK